MQQGSSVSRKSGLRDAAPDHPKRRRALQSGQTSSTDENASINIAHVYQQNDEFTSPDLDRIKKTKVSASPCLPPFRRKPGDNGPLKSIVSPKPGHLKALKSYGPRSHLPPKLKSEETLIQKPNEDDVSHSAAIDQTETSDPSSVSVKQTVDDAAVLSALRSIISTMEANNASAKLNESNFRDSGEGANDNPQPNSEDLRKNTNASVDEEDRRGSTTSTISILSHHSERSSLICVDTVPVTDEYVSVTTGNKDVVPETETAPPKSDKILVFPRTEMLERAMALGLTVVDVFDRSVRNNHTYFVLSVQVCFSGYVYCCLISFSYVIVLQVLQIPGVLNNGMRMMVMKRFSEFKELRHNLVNSIEASSGSIPPLPTRQVLSMG